MTETTPLITGVDFVCIPAQDFDAMTSFYSETLGLPFVKRYGSRPGAAARRRRSGHARRRPRPPWSRLSVPRAP